MRSITWLEVIAWGGLTLLLLSLLGVALRYVWMDKVRRIQCLEAWRERHEAGETQMLLVVRDLQNESRNHTKILERMEKQFEGMGNQLRDVAALVGNRRTEDRRWEDGGLKVHPLS
ncbi:MAG: hypothetical protein Q8K67_11315 [Geothrix sp.]|nr:hypothetical protein [Geothrix sp.]